MINPFVICSVDELALLQAYADGQIWELQCRALGATLEQCRAYDMDAWRFATTTIYPNQHVVNYARRVAQEALKRGEPMPTSAEATINAAEMRELARLINR